LKHRTYHYSWREKCIIKIKLINKIKRKAARADNKAARADNKAARVDNKAARVDNKVARADNKAARVDNKAARADNKAAKTAVDNILKKVLYAPSFFNALCLLCVKAL
jgi:hypothetical protein